MSSVGSCLFHSVPDCLVDIKTVLVLVVKWAKFIHVCTVYTGKEFAKFVIHKKLFPSRTTITILRVATVITYTPKDVCNAIFHAGQ